MAWRALSSQFEVVRNVEAVTEEAIEATERKVRTRLREMPAFVGRKFKLPPSLCAFYLAAQDRLKRTGRHGDIPFTFYALEWLPTDGIGLADEARGDSTPWLEIGCFGEAHWVFICCDPEDPMYGSIVDREDTTPWAQTVYEAEVYPGLEDFLRELATAVA